MKMREKVKKESRNSNRELDMSLKKHKKK